LTNGKGIGEIDAMNIEYRHPLKHTYVLGHPSEELECATKAAELRACGWTVRVRLTFSQVPPQKAIKAAGPTPLVVGDCSVLRILTVSRAMILSIKVPCAVGEEATDGIVREHVQKCVRKTFDYMIAEGFISDRNYMLTIALSQK
jgi:hypothetical protein